MPPSFSVLVTICHLVTLGDVQRPVCHEEIATSGRTHMEACQLAQAGIAQWWGNSRWSDEDYEIGGWRCVPDSEALSQRGGL